MNPRPGSYGSYGSAGALGAFGAAGKSIIVNKLFLCTHKKHLSGYYTLLVYKNIFSK